MSDYRVITDATCDIDPALAEAHHIQVIPMEVILDDKTFYHYADFRNYPAKDYYQKLREGAKSHTSAINPQTYIDTFTPVLKGGEDILYLCFSSGLSSTYQSSVLAVSQLRDEFPDRKIYTIDTLCACGGEGFLVYYTALNHDHRQARRVPQRFPGQCDGVRHHQELIRRKQCGKKAFRND